LAGDLEGIHSRPGAHQRFYVIWYAPQEITISLNQ